MQLLSVLNLRDFVSLFFCKKLQFYFLCYRRGFLWSYRCLYFWGKEMWYEQVICFSTYVVLQVLYFVTVAGRNVFLICPYQMVSDSILNSFQGEFCRYVHRLQQKDFGLICFIACWNYFLPVFPVAGPRSISAAVCL